MLPWHAIPSCRRPRCAASFAPTAPGSRRCWAARPQPPTWVAISAPTLTEAELRYLARHEWARTAEDVVWRRSKLGLRLSPTQIAAIGAAMDRITQEELIPA